jgi:UDP:flavonoid glycosyltransferase YjiC (YdhE family)
MMDDARPIVMLASGTRGDVQPLLALAHAMQLRGHAVRVASHAPFRTMIERAGLQFAPLSDNPSDWLARTPTLFTARPTPVVLRNTLRYVRVAQVMTARLLDSALAACDNAGLIVGGLASLWAGEVADAARARLAWAFLQPLTPTGSFACSVWPLWRDAGTALNRLSYRAIDAVSTRPWRAVIARWRRARGLSEEPGGLLQRAHARADAVLNAFSPQLVPAPPDWPAACAPLGFWHVPQGAAPPGAMVPDDLERFIGSAGDVIYVGTGAGSAMDARALMSFAHDAALRLKLRVLANVHGIEALPPAYADRMRVVRDVPHAALFPRMRAVVHHGGAGTTAAALRAGVATVVLPVFADQFFWSARVHAAGIAPRPLPQRGLDRARFVAAIEQAVSDPTLRARAGQLAAQERAEDGVARAVERLETLARR